MEGYARGDGMALGQGEMRSGSSRSTIYTRQFSNIDTDLTSGQIQFDSCRSNHEAHKDSGRKWVGTRFEDEDAPERF